MYEWYLSEKAKGQLAEIIEHTIDKYGEEQALKYRRQLEEAFSQIVRRPDLGKARGNCSEEVLSRKQGVHYIFYREDENENIKISEIVHERRNLENYFDEDMQAEKRAYEREKAERKRRDDLDYDLER